jgi:hypothetical protein
MEGWVDNLVRELCITQKHSLIGKDSFWKRDDEDREFIAVGHNATAVRQRLAGGKGGEIDAVTRIAEHNFGIAVPKHKQNR